MSSPKIVGTAKVAERVAELALEAAECLEKPLDGNLIEILERPSRSDVPSREPVGQGPVDHHEALEARRL